MEIIATKCLSFTYPGQETAALREVSFQVASGEFAVLCGPSACGKTTLLRQLKPSLAAHGALTGEIRCFGAPLANINERDEAQKIGFVMQNPDSQIVTDKVWHELAFGLESLGMDSKTIRLRVAEMSAFFGISDWFHKNVSELSGGQRQLLALASVMAMQPDILLLDEPTSQLDPIAAAEFLQTVSRINRDLGVTVILTEHRLEEALPLANRVLVMENGSIVASGDPRQVGETLLQASSNMFLAMPVPMRVWAAVSKEGQDKGQDKGTVPLSTFVSKVDRVTVPLSCPLSCPISVREGRIWLDEIVATVATVAIVQTKTLCHSQMGSEAAIDEPLPAVAVELDNIWFRYTKQGQDVLKGTNFKAYSGQITAILGGNAAGKSTALGVMAGLHKQHRGTVKLHGSDLAKIPTNQLFTGLLGVLPQNPQALFTCNTVAEDLDEMLAGQHLNTAEKDQRLAKIVELCQLGDVLESHPYDLSGGEQQRAALAKVLLLKPRILLLDEPTKGFDANFKVVFAAILHSLTEQGVTVVMASHDIEFCAEYANNCAMLFDGSIASEADPRKFFSGNSFYTSAANRMARHILPQAITAQDIIDALTDGDRGDSDLTKVAPRSLGSASCVKTRPVISGKTSLPLGFRRWLSPASPLDSPLDCPAHEIRISWGPRGTRNPLERKTRSLEPVPELPPQTTPQLPQLAPASKIPKRTLTATIVCLIAIPLTILAGIYLLGNNHYNIISLVVLLEAMSPFALLFEGRKPQAREIVLVSVLTAIAVVGRTAFFMVPQFKPGVALVIIAAVALGKESGFLVGALCALISNMFFGQGPWTPWQMFAMGSIGFLAGALFSKDALLKYKAPLAIFGAVVTLVIYGGLTNTAMVIMYQPLPTPEMFAVSYLQGLPFDLIHVAATVFFILLLAKTMLQKLARIKKNYGLIAR